ncbi:DUF1622 domain-containing protein [Methanolobus sp. ZRKC3]|uniref:DUF1622 domain-containing protein n=1 Tax=Methanolobus sp. ZRKC3 TaxID=3125786 RepID=UPI0032537D95
MSALLDVLSIWSSFILEGFAIFFILVGSLLIIYGGIRSSFEILLLEALKKAYTYSHIRRELTNKIVFGLEFMIAGDILRTVLEPSESEIIILGAVVVIRTILGYFLSKEVKEYQLD